MRYIGSKRQVLPFIQKAIIENCYLLDVSKDDIEKRQYKSSRFMIEDLMIRSEIERFCSENNCGNCDKTLTAKLMANAIESGTFILSEESKKNFKELFDRVFSYCT